MCAVASGKVTDSLATDAEEDENGSLFNLLLDPMGWSHLQATAPRQAVQGRRPATLCAAHAHTTLCRGAHVCAGESFRLAHHQPRKRYVRRPAQSGARSVHNRLALLRTSV